jgi:hypothetical protein
MSKHDMNFGWSTGILSAALENLREELKILPLIQRDYMQQLHDPVDMDSDTIKVMLHTSAFKPEQTKPRRKRKPKQKPDPPVRTQRAISLDDER